MVEVLLVPTGRTHDPITVQVQRRGRRQMAKLLCPWHRERTPSCTISFVQRLFYCFGCQVHGEAIVLEDGPHGH